MIDTGEIDGRLRLHVESPKRSSISPTILEHFIVDVLVDSSIPDSTEFLTNAAFVSASRSFARASHRVL
jgi:hypothetical protein